MSRSRACLLLLLTLSSGIEGMHLCMLPLICTWHASVQWEIDSETERADVRRNTTTVVVQQKYSVLNILYTAGALHARLLCLHPLLPVAYYTRLGNTL